MIIRCPSCATTYKVSGSVFDAPRPTFRCTRCKHIFTFQVRLQLDDEDPSAAAATTNQMPEAGAAGDGPVGGGGSDTDEEPYAEGRVDTHDSQASRVEAAGSHTGAAQGTLELPRYVRPKPSRRAEIPSETQAVGEDYDEIQFDDPDFDPPVEADQPDVQPPELFEQTAAGEEDDVPIRRRAEAGLRDRR